MAAVRCNKWFLCRFLAAVFGFLKRIFFGRFHRRNKSDTDLPTVASGISIPGAVTTSLTGEEVDAADWDDWDYSGAPTGIVIEPTDPRPGQGGPPQQNPTAAGPPADEDDLPETDYFSDMMPTLKKTVLIRKKDRSRGGLPNSGMTNRLSMNVDTTPVVSSELSAWEEGGHGTWEDEAAAVDLSWDADRVIKEKRQAERDKRTAEQHRKKMEREAQRSQRKDGGKLAVKLK